MRKLKSTRPSSAKLDVYYGDSVGYEEEAFQFFDNQPKLITPEKVSALLFVERPTVYEWKCRPEKFEVPPPEQMFIKQGRKLLLRTDILKKWCIARATIAR